MCIRTFKVVLENAKGDTTTCYVDAEWAPSAVLRAIQVMNTQAPDAVTPAGPWQRRSVEVHI